MTALNQTTGDAYTVLRRSLAGITAAQGWARGNLVRTAGALIPGLNPGRDQADNATLPGGAGIQGGHIGGQFMTDGGPTQAAVSKGREGTL